MALRVAGAQLNLTVGDISGNEEKIAAAMKRAADAGADVLVVPELAIPGYPPEDLVLRRDFVEANIAALRRLARASGTMTSIVGFVDFATGRGRGADDAEPRGVANAAAVVSDGRVRGVYHKVLLPNYGVFDEDRYFVEGADPDRIWDIEGIPVGVSVCEDIWLPDGPPSLQAANGASVLLNINASPFHRGKAAEREEMLTARARAGGASVIYLNLVGGQDELVFDGASVVIGSDGELLHRSPQFEEDFFVVDVPVGDEAGAGGGSIAPLLEPTEEIYRALTVGLRDYCRKNQFEGVVIQLSGGIDSAVTATIAHDALGPDSVWSIGMPSIFSSGHSVEDARNLAENLGIRFDLVPIEGIFAAYTEALEDVFAGTEFGVAEENLQARARGTIAMAVSNKFGPMVLATGNKSEMAVGYATLYGDMVGGYSVLKDVFKGVVYELARWRNKTGQVIPQNIIDKPPSAELRPGQKDSDSLPPYELLDAILQRYIEDDMGVTEIIADGYDSETVHRVARLVDANEYKRRQSAPGVKITTKAFGKDRRLPITNHYRPPAS
jgi:NAD+ synthase (glutamine-hydrolysing)